MAESRANFKGSEQDYFGTRQQVVLDLRTAYFGYLAARRAMKVQEETVKQNQELTKQAQGFYQVGLKAKIDVTKAEANLYQAEANLIQAKNNVELARVTLMNALGIKTWPYKDVEDVLEVTPQPRPLEELLAQATERRPELQKNRFQQEFNQAAIKVARAGYFPTFSSTAAYGWQSIDQPFATLPSNWYVGASMTFPLFNGLATQLFGEPEQGAAARHHGKFRGAAPERHQGSEPVLSQRQVRLGAHPGHQKGHGGGPGEPAPGLGPLPGRGGHHHRSPPTPRCSFPRRNSISSRPYIITGCSRPNWTRPWANRIEF